MQKNDTPHVSVLMGTLYHRDSLTLMRRCVESILNQTFTEFEFLICDDGSSEAAKELLDSYAHNDARVRLIRPGNKYDLASKLNACLSAAKGKYIARMDDDDYSSPSRFERQVEDLKLNPFVSFVGCNVNLIQEGKQIGIRRFPEFPQVKDFYMTQPYIHPALMFRRNVIDEVGGYSEGNRQVLCEDYDLLLRLYAKGYAGKNIQQPLLDYSIPADGGGSRKMCHRWNETVTRFWRFRELGALPGALPYVFKPLVVGVIPKRFINTIRGRSI